MDGREEGQEEQEGSFQLLTYTSIDFIAFHANSFIIHPIALKKLDSGGIRRKTWGGVSPNIDRHSHRQNRLASHRAIVTTHLRDIGGGV